MISWFSGLESLLFCVQCEGCQSSHSALSHHLCSACHASIGSLPKPSTWVEGSGHSFDQVLPCVFYSQRVRSLVHAFKYERKHYLSKLFMHWIERKLSSHPIHNWHLVTAVPVSKSSLKERGFNQSALLASLVAKYLQLPDASKYLEKVRHTNSQARLTRAERLDNLENSFRVHPQTLFEGQKVLLIDDVLTTGATVNECAKQLKQAGATSVDVLVLAKGS